jgi:hypothetical protein
MTCKKSCYFCKHGVFNRGFAGTYWEPPEPSYTECNNGAIDFLALDKIMDIDDEEALPLVCGHYEPRIVEKCGECRKEINVPEDEIEFYVEETPVCSKECRVAGYKKFDEQFNF